MEYTIKKTYQKLEWEKKLFLLPDKKLQIRMWFKIDENWNPSKIIIASNELWDVTRDINSKDWKYWKFWYAKPYRGVVIFINSNYWKWWITFKIDADTIEKTLIDQEKTKLFDLIPEENF